MYSLVLVLILVIAIIAKGLTEDPQTFSRNRNRVRKPAETGRNGIGIRRWKPAEMEME